MWLPSGLIELPTYLRLVRIQNSFSILEEFNGLLFVSLLRVFYLLTHFFPWAWSSIIIVVIVIIDVVNIIVVRLPNFRFSNHVISFFGIFFSYKKKLYIIDKRQFK